MAIRESKNVYHKSPEGDELCKEMICDFCGRRLDKFSPDAGELAEKARKSGWKLKFPKMSEPGKWVCDICDR